MIAELRAIRAIACDAPLSLWLLDLTVPWSVGEFARLSDYERERAARFHSPHDRARYVAAHVGLRTIIESACGINAETQQFERGVHGKWRLAGGTPWRFNLSYAGDTALVGIGEDDEIGVDIEVDRVIEDADALAAIYFNARECEAYHRGDADPQAAAFLGGWTRKEACLKALGVGLQLAPTELDTGLSGERLIVYGGGELDVGSFWLDGFVAAWARVR